MNTTKKALTQAQQEHINDIARIEKNLQGQKEASLLQFKQDARRTSLQLAERFSKNSEGNKASEISIILANAELCYQWLTTFPTTDNEAIMKLLESAANNGAIS